MYKHQAHTWCAEMVSAGRTLPQEYWCNVQEARKREESGFDHSKYLHLSKVRENHERYLRAAAVAAQPAVPASQGQAVPGNTSQEPHAHEPGAKGKVE